MDYYREYIEVIDVIVSKFIEKQSVYFEVDNFSVAKAVGNSICSMLMCSNSREIYNDLRLNGRSIYEAQTTIEQKFLLQFEPQQNEVIDKVGNKDYHSYTYLEELCNCTMVFCLNPRQLKLWKPIINRLEKRILLLCNFESGTDIDLDGDITVLDLSFILERVVVNSYIERCFPQIYHYANLFAMLIETIKPSEVLVMEGCHSETEILASLCKRDDIKSVCYQQGWPSIMHTRFRNMGYDEFVTWGSGFNALWKRYNHNVHFIAGGYPYKTINCKKSNIITFFLQSPIMIIDDNYFNAILDLALAIAQNSRNFEIHIREHPEFRLSDSWKQRFNSVHNVKFVSDKPLEDVFKRTLISVSVFSSTLIESLVHGSIPFIFDLSQEGVYYPSSKSWAIETKTFDDGFEKLLTLINTPDLQKHYIDMGKKYKAIFYTNE